MLPFLLKRQKMKRATSQTGDSPVLITLISSRFAHTLVELINASACINELLLACVERVALGADVDTELRLRGPCLKCLTASTTDCNQLGFGMAV